MILDILFYMYLCTRYYIPYTYAQHQQSLRMNLNTNRNTHYHNCPHSPVDNSLDRNLCNCLDMFVHKFENIRTYTKWCNFPYNCFCKSQNKLHNNHRYMNPYSWYSQKHTFRNSYTPHWFLY